MPFTPVDPARPSVPFRQVALSAAALWLCYFVLITLRGLVVELGEFHELLWRRALVTLCGIAITIAVWPVLRRFDGRSLMVRLGVALVIMLPAALALAFINHKAFAPVEQRLLERAIEEQRAATGATPTPGVRIRHDVSGNVLLDVMDDGAVPPPLPPVPAPGASPVPPAPPPVGVSIRKNADGSTEVRAPGILIRKEAPESDSAADAIDAVDSATTAAARRKLEGEGLWRQLTDVALGRYFLLIAWAALYLALGNGEQARAAEYQAGEYRRAAKASELRSLRYQVNPHFLFNTLNSLSALVMVGRTEQAERMIQTISSFYRHSLAGDPTADVPLADEIALQRHYLEIEAVRFPDRLRTEFDIPERLENACVPGMILQPLVENSIKYAVSATSRPVTIRITAREADGLLVLTVADDGPGEAAATGLPASGTGIGLANVRSRLAASFGDAASVESGPLPAGGHATVLTMPVVRSDC